MSDRFKMRFWDKEEKYFCPNTGNPNLFMFNGKIAMTCNGSATGTVNDRDGLEEYYIAEQSTGLNDSNGRTIFEGDIVKAAECNLMSETDFIGIFTVKWGEQCYAAFDLYPSQDWEYNALQYYVVEGWLEVIGNIHENPELLEAS